MHLGPETDYNYMMEENMIADTMEEKDLDIIIDNKLNFQNHINKQVNKANQKLGLIRDRPFNLKWGVMVFRFVPIFFFGQHKSSNINFPCRAKREFFFQYLTLGYMTKTLNQIIFFSSTKIRIFFSATLEIRIFF